MKTPFTRFLAGAMLFLLAGTTAYACSCFGADNYCSNLRMQAPGQYSVYRVEVLNHYFPIIYEGEFYSNLLSDMRIISSLTENAPLSDTITVLGQDGVSCGYWLDGLEEGGEYIITVWNTATVDSLFIGNPAAYYTFDYPATTGFTFCGVNALRINGEMIEGVEGPIYPDINTMVLEDFLQEFEACRQFSLNTDRPEDALELVVFPNPAINELQIQLLESGLEGIELWTSTGQLVFQRTSFNQGTTSTRLNVVDLNPGLYLLVVYGEYKRATQRIMIK